MSTVSYPHIEIRDDGACIVGDGVKFKVRVLVEAHLAGGADAEELKRDYPQLSLSQIHSALAYYYDHQQEIDREIAELCQLAQELQAHPDNQAVSQKFRDAWQQRAEPR
jgi:uncharacterized protein (DUF433 family)